MSVASIEEFCWFLAVGVTRKTGIADFNRELKNNSRINIIYMLTELNKYHTVLCLPYGLEYCKELTSRSQQENNKPFIPTVQHPSVQ